MEIFGSYSGGDFLVFYGLMLLTCVAAGIWIPATLRPQGKPGSVHGIEETAVLVGGTSQHATALLTDLFTKGALEDAGKGRLRVVSKEHEAGPAGRAILGEVGALKLGHVKSTLKSHATQVEADLIERGLIMDQGQRLTLRFLSALPYFVLFVIGLYRQQAGEAQGEPTGILTFLLIVTFIFGLLRFFTGTKRTIAGQQVVKSLEEESSRLRRAPQANEAGFAVALFGTGVLVGTPWEPVHAARQAGSGGDGGYAGDSDSGDSGGSGCGGGGCGGCGG